MKFGIQIFLVICICFSCKKVTSVPAEIEKEELILPPVVAKQDSVIDELEKIVVGDTITEFPGEVLLNQQDNKKFTSRFWQGIPSIEISSSGILFACWYTGWYDEGPGNYVTVSISKDQGKTWLSNQIVINPTVTPYRFFDPVLWKDKYGTVFIAWAASKNKWDGEGGVWYSKISYDAEIKCSKPVYLAPGVMMNKPTDTNDGKTTNYPIAHWSFSTPDPNARLINIYSTKYSDYFKKSFSFKKSSSIPFSLALRSYDEHELIQLKDGSYFAMIRGVDAIYYARSKDISSWETPKKFTQLGATNSEKFFLGRLKSGKIILIFNNSLKRNNLKVYLSSDEGNTWTNGFLLDNLEDVSYPELTQDAQSNIYIIYDCDRHKKMLINCVKMTEGDILANKTENILRYVVSSAKQF